LPGVVDVEVAISVDRPARRIIHLKDWHFLPRDLFAADIQDQANRPISDAEMDDLYEFLLESELVQIEQKTLLRCLIKLHGLTPVLQEGLTRQDLPIYQANVKALRETKKRLLPLKNERSQIDATLTDLEKAKQQRLAAYKKLAQIRQKIDSLFYSYRLDLLRIGAAGQLRITGELAEVLPLDDAESLDRANPLREGIVLLDSDAIEARQDAQVRELMKAGEFAFVILGGAHDLSDNLAKLAGGDCEYVVVTTKSHRKFSQSQ
jgi:hypothetical protein